MAQTNTERQPTEYQPWIEWVLECEVDDPSLARQGRMASLVIILAELVTLAALVIGFVSGISQGENVETYLAAGVGVAALLPLIYFVNRRGLIRLAGIAMAVLVLGVSVAVILVAGPLSPAAATLIAPIIVAGLFGPPSSAIALALISMGIYLGFNIWIDPAYLSQILAGGPALQSTLVYLNIFFVAVMSWLFSQTTIDALEQSQSMSLALTAQREDLERRLNAQTRQLQATVTVARSIAGERDMDQLLEDIVRLVRETFGYYHVQVFLVDDNHEYAVLRQSTGDIGREMLDRGHRLPVGSLSVVGQSTASGRPVIARDTDADTVHFRNRLLPNTRSEMAVPLMLAGRVIGAIDLQSAEPDAFSEEAIPTLQALADQLAVAIENARLYEQTRENLRELRELSRDTTRRSWSDFLAEMREEERRQIYGPESRALGVHRSRVIERVLSAGSMIVSSGNDGRQAFVAAPIIVRNEVVGVIGVEPDEPVDWTRDDLQLLKSIADRAALAVENARLYLQAQRSAERERLIGEIAARLQRAPSLALLLESVTKELAEALGTDNVYAEISLDRPLARIVDGHDAAGQENVRVGTVEGHAQSRDIVGQDESGEARK